MSVTGKTLGIVLIGLVGLLVYLGIYIGSVYGLGIAHSVIYFGLAMTAIMLLVTTALASGKEE
ncbi:hypothetical protein [Novispirillum itersonii]|uniref:ABC-type Na+ efflux pump permease subunit n=1 Tax=Novispirillum itersonii TaxID=189 RepID=A0A7X0DKZ4_NOVIT|nr:hypothetical protein [Novispirillum itersonii]MBB6209478.1 ABC-type Na+ efflux pump permease subunit [Novispirillum itersonii]